MSHFEDACATSILDREKQEIGITVIVTVLDIEAWVFKPVGPLF